MRDPALGSADDRMTSRHGDDHADSPQAHAPDPRPPMFRSEKMPSVTPGTRSTVFTASVGILTVCSLLLLASSAPSANAYVGYPSAIVVLGHSGATGESSDPSRPAYEARENSWATGTNPAVNSVYLRILAKNPGIKGHNVNLAQRRRGRRRSRAPGSAGRRKLSPRPTYSDPDHGRRHRLHGKGDATTPRFRSTFITALQLLAQGAPKSSIFVVSQFGSPRVPGGCSALPSGRDSEAPGRCLRRSPRPARPEGACPAREIIHGYEAHSKPAASSSRSAGTTAAPSADRRQARRTANDGVDHFSIKGHGKAAAVAWAALKRAGLVPRSG